MEPNGPRTPTLNLSTSISGSQNILIIGPGAGRSIVLLSGEFSNSDAATSDTLTIYSGATGNPTIWASRLSFDGGGFPVQFHELFLPPNVALFGSLAGAVTAGINLRYYIFGRPGPT